MYLLYIHLWINLKYKQPRTYIIITSLPQENVTLFRTVMVLITASYDYLQFHVYTDTL